MKILAIGAHADDVELGCGGSLHRWARMGHEIFIHIVTTSEYSDPNGAIIRSAEDATREAECASSLIGAKLSIGNHLALQIAFGENLNASMINVIDDILPDIVLTHDSCESHPDHIAVGMSTVHACRRVPRLLTYRSNSYISGESWNPRFFIDITADMEKKLSLISSFVGENTRTGGAWLEWCRAEARVRGFSIGVNYAEAFSIVKWLAGSSAGSFNL